MFGFPLLGLSQFQIVNDGGLFCKITVAVKKPKLVFNRDLGDEEINGTCSISRVK